MISCASLDQILSAPGSHGLQSRSREALLVLGRKKVVEEAVNQLSLWCLDNGTLQEGGCWSFLFPKPTPRAKIQGRGYARVSGISPTTTSITRITSFRLIRKGVNFTFSHSALWTDPRALEVRKNGASGLPGRRYLPAALLHFRAVTDDDALLVAATRSIS